MSRFNVKIRGKTLGEIDLGPPLEAAGINLTATQYEGQRPEYVLAHLDAESAEEAKARVTSALPGDDYLVDEPVQTD